MFHRRSRRDRVWTALGYAVATLGLQTTLSCAPRTSREFTEIELDAAPTGGRPLPPDGQAGTGGTGGSGGSPGGEDGSGGIGGGPSGLPPDTAPPPPPDAPIDVQIDPPPGDSGPAPVDAMPEPPDSTPDTGVATLGMGLVSRWKLDEMNGNTIADVLGTNPGTLNGAARAMGGFPGAQYNNPGSLRFDGDNDFVALGTTRLPANNRPQSVTFWFNVSATPANPQICVSLTDGQEEGSRLKLGFRSGRVAAWQGGSSDLAAGAAVEPGWHHYAYTYDGTTHRLYVDGAFAGMSANDPDDGAVANARLGAGYDNAENFLGQLDEIRIYNRPLSPVEVTALHAGQE
jgi:hypothetical protein